MRLHIRTLLLTVALLCSMTSIASACIYVPILEPFYWLFGGGCGHNGGGYGYGNYGNGCGYGPNPYGVSRCIDDWLGYGYLRNQQGTLGHYPGRPIGSCHAFFPRLLDPCSWLAPCPLFAPCGPSYGMTAPMVAPLAPLTETPCQMPYQPQWQNRGQCSNRGQWQIPMPAMMNPCGGMCNDPCGSPCMPQPMVSCQPAQVPVTTWRPMTIDRGSWRTVWVPRPVTTLVPQTQYFTSGPAMQMPMMDSGCGGACGGGMGNMMPGPEMMQGTGYPDMNSGSGCCGSDSGFSQPGFQSGAPVAPQSTMLMSPGSMSMSRTSMGQPYNIAPYSSMSRWYTHPGYGQSMAARPAYSTAMYRQPQSRHFASNAAMMPAPQTSGWQMVPPGPAQMRTTPMMTQMMPPQFSVMPSQRPMSPLIGGTMPETVYGRPIVAGDINGDHELNGPSAAAVPVVPNSFNGRSPIQQATWSQSARTASIRRYPNSVQ